MRFIKNLFLLLLIFSFLAPSCKKQAEDENGGVQEINLELLKEQKWIFAGEETSGDTIYYRPESYDLPPARGREAFQLKEKEGMMTYYAISPSDFPMVHDSATYSLEDGIMTFNIPGNEYANKRRIQFRILELDSEKLKALAIY